MSEIIKIGTMGSGGTVKASVSPCGRVPEASSQREVLFGDTVQFTFENISTPYDILLSVVRQTNGSQPVVHCGALSEDDISSIPYNWTVAPFEFLMSQSENTMLQTNDTLVFIARDQADNPGTQVKYQESEFVRVVEQRTGSGAIRSLGRTKLGVLVGALLVPGVLIGM